MTLSPRARVLAGGAFAAALAVASLTGCSAGQVTQTNLAVPAVPGVNDQIPLPNGEELAVRNVFVQFGGPNGYPRGGTAVLQARIFNDTAQPVTVRISSTAAQGLTVSGPAPAAPPPPPASPSGTASPGAPPPPPPPAAPTPFAEVTIPAFGFAAFGEATERQLRLVNLTNPVGSGQSVPVVFAFGAAGTLTLPVPVAPPLEPGPRPSAVVPPEAEHG